MDPFPEDIETDLVNLSRMSMLDLSACDESVLARSMRRILVQVERPRSNIGQGPPGRAD
jgi:hypothetical protein